MVSAGEWVGQRASDWLLMGSALTSVPVCLSENPQLLESLVCCWSQSPIHHVCTMVGQCLQEPCLSRLADSAIACTLVPSVLTHSGLPTGIK